MTEDALLLQILGENLGRFLQKAAIARAECVESVAVDIDLADDPSVGPDRNNDLRFRFDGAGEIPCNSSLDETYALES